MKDLLTKRASFVQHSLPGLAPGHYQIQVHQTLLESAADGAKDITGGLPALTRNFGVAAARFALAQNAIHSVFPPDNSAGEFSNALPHVVLLSETLPWIRSPYSPLNVPETEVHSYRVTIGGTGKTIDYDGDRASWLAVFAVSPSDFGGDDPERKIVQGTIQDLVPTNLTVANPSGAALPGKLPANGYSVFSYLREPQYSAIAGQPINPGIGQLVTDALQYLDIPAARFNAICPSLDDLKMMAHVRAVQMEHKAIPPDRVVDPEQRYALVIGNRLPESRPDSDAVNSGPPRGANVALLVSLESMEFALRGHSPGNDYDTAIAARPDGFVRLVVLYRWRFTSWQDTSFEFETLLKGLNGRDPRSPNETVRLPNPFPRMPAFSLSVGDDDGKAIVRDMLASGYVPFNHVSRLPMGKDNPAPITTVSWYRGPLIPFGAFVPLIDFIAAAKPAFYSADQLLRLDPNVGIYDVSCALAWQLGRMLALSDKDFSTALYRWKKQVSMSYRTEFERAALLRWYAALLPLTGAAERIRTQSVGTSLTSALLRRLASREGL